MHVALRLFALCPAMATLALVAGCQPAWTLTDVTVNGPAPLGGTSPVNPVDLVAPSQRIVDMAARISRRQTPGPDVFFEAQLSTGSQTGWASPFRIPGHNVAGHGPIMRVDCARNASNAQLTITMSRTPILAHETIQVSTFSATAAPSVSMSIRIHVDALDARRSGGGSWDAPAPLLVTCRLPAPIAPPVDPGPGTTPIN